MAPSREGEDHAFVRRGEGCSPFVRREGVAFSPEREEGKAHRRGESAFALNEMEIPPMAQAKWEVLRITGDTRPNRSSFHRTHALAHAAYLKALEESEWYAVDMLYLPTGNGRKESEPLYGRANGFDWIEHEGRAVWSNKRLNELMVD